MGKEDEKWTDTPPHKRKFDNSSFMGFSKLTRAHVELIHQWAQRSPLIEGYYSKRVHLFGCFVCYFRGTLLWQWELWANFAILLIPFSICAIWYKEPQHHYVKHCAEIFHDWVSGYARFFLGLYISVVLSRYFHAFNSFGGIYGATQNLSLSVSTLLKPSGENDAQFQHMRNKIKNWITLGWTIMALQAHFTKTEWVDYLKTKGYVTVKEWELLGSLGKYDRGALVFKWIDTALVHCAETGRMRYPEYSLPKIMDRVASARGAALSFDTGWIIPLPYMYVVLISSLIKCLLLVEATILGMDVALADLLDVDAPVPADFPKWFTVGIQVLLLCMINAVLYSAVSIQAVLENPWGSATEGPFNGGAQHASQLPFEEFTWLLENRVKVLFDEELTKDMMTDFTGGLVGDAPRGVPINGAGDSKGPGVQGGTAGQFVFTRVDAEGEGGA